MPAYPWLLTDALDYSLIDKKVEAMRTLGVPYEEGFAIEAAADLEKQSRKVAGRLVDSGMEIAPDREIIALIAYMQRLGTDIRADATLTGRHDKLMVRVEAGGGYSAYYPLIDAAGLAAGKAIFESPRNLCYTCHRHDLGGQVGPDLTDGAWIKDCNTGDIMTSIKRGNQLKGMLPYGSGKKLDDVQLHQVASYIVSMRGSNPANPKKPDLQRESPCETETW